MRKPMIASCAAVALILASFSAFGFIGTTVAPVPPGTPQPGALAGFGFALLAAGQWLNSTRSSL
jgi:hypothetical protein